MTTPPATTPPRSTAASSTTTAGPGPLLTRAASRHPDEPAIVTPNGVQRTYGELAATATVLAAGMRVAGVGPGDRVIVRARADADAVAAMFAVWWLGAVLVPLHPELTDVQLEGIVADCRAALVVDETAGPAPGVGSPVTTTVALESAGLAVDVSPPLPGHAPEDLACLLYTSGSTAAPKGVRCPAAAMDAALEGIAERLGYRAEDSVALLSPLSFDYGLYQVLLAFRVGAQVVLADASDVRGMICAVRGTAVSVLPVVPAIGHMLHALLRRGGPVDSVRMVTSTGADLSPQRIAELREVLPKARIVAMYGITECKRVTIAEPDVDRVRPRSVGTALPGTRVEIHDDDGGVLPPGRVGEIVVFGPHVMDGYWERPEITASRFGRTATGERFLRTGDHGRLDADGHLYFHGRTDDVFKAKGVRTSSTEIAAAVEAVDGVREVVVVPPREERGLVVVVTTSLSPAEVLTDVARRLEPQKVPVACVVVETMPLTANGKIDVRRVIREYEESL